MGINLGKLIKDHIYDSEMVQDDLLKVDVMRNAIEEDGLSFHEAYELANIK